MYHISSQTRKAIHEALGHDVVLVSFSTFEAHGQRRTRYTVRSPNGTKHIHLISYENGSILRAA